MGGFNLAKSTWTPSVSSSNPEKPGRLNAGFEYLQVFCGPSLSPSSEMSITRDMWPATFERDLAGYFRGIRKRELG